jgi:hypothetical protein
MVRAKDGLLRGGIGFSKELAVRNRRLGLKLTWLIRILFSICLAAVIASMTSAVAQGNAQQPHSEISPSDFLSLEEEAQVNAPQSPSEIRKAAEGGDATAQFRLALDYFNGLEGIPKNSAEAVTWLRKAAEQGHARAQYSLGLLYHEGTVTAQDDAEAAKWIRKAADQGDAGAQCDLALMYYKGEGVAQDYVEAVKWYRKAAGQGHAGAQHMLGSMFYYGQGVSKDYAEAAKWYHKAAYQDDAVAQVFLGLMYSNGQGVTQDHAEAAKWYRRAAERGNEEAQYRIGVSYATGIGVSQDYTEAAEWYRKAGEQGHTLSMVQLGLCYRLGTGVEQNDLEAFKWFKKAAELGDSLAQFHMGISYSEGLGVTQNYVEAAKWTRKAAEHENSNAQYLLGLMYAVGKGVPQDYSEAVKLYRRAAEQGYADAQFELASMYYNGRGVAQDYAEAAKWYRYAAEQGYARAQYNLASMYYFGEGVTQDYVQAHLWANLAGAGLKGKDQEKAVKKRDEIAMKMAPQQIAEAQRLARTFSPRNGEANSDRDQPTTAPKEPGKVMATGTGFFITEDGYLVTNAHVLGDGSTFQVMTKDGILPARFVQRDPANDLAVLKVEGRQTALPLQPSRGVRLGQSVATVGFPNVGLQGFMPKAARGEIAGLAGAQDDPRHFQISVPIQPGNSGGPLVDLHGNVVGVIVAKLDQAAALASSGTLAENVNYAIKSGFLLTFLESLPTLSGHLQEPSIREIKFEDAIAMVEKATVLVLVYR